MTALLSAFEQNPKKVKFYGEDPDEKIVLVLRRHIITNFRWVFMVAILLVLPPLIPVLETSMGINLLAGVPPELTGISLLFYYLFLAGFSFMQYLLWFFNVHIVSTKRIVDMDFFGFLHRNTTDAPLRNVEDVTHTTGGAAQVIFNYGDVIIQTAGEKRELDFHSVPHPSKVQDLISDMVAELRVNSYDNN